MSTKEIETLRKAVATVKVAIAKTPPPVSQQDVSEVVSESASSQPATT